MQFLDNSKHLFHVWLANARASIVREMEFRGNFVIGIFRQLLWLGAFMLMINVIFQNTSSLSGWNQYEVLTVLALSRIVESLMGIIFVDNIIGISDRVQKGTFDYILTKPLPLQFATFFNRVSFQSLGNSLAGIVLLGYVAFNYEPVTWYNIFLAAFIAFLGVTIYYSLLVTVASLVFYIERLQTLWGFSNLFSEPLTVPFDIFPAAPRIVMTYLIPIAFVVFVPAQAVVGRLQFIYIPIAIGIAFLFLTIANLAWRTGLRRYTSASS